MIIMSQYLDPYRVSLLFKMSSQQALQLWKSQIPLYERIIARCSKSVTTPLTRFLPPNFQQKISELSQILNSRDIQNYENYLDVIAHYIEGVKNKSNIQLADLLVRQIGGNIQFWLNVILDVAENVNYAGQFTLWHIRKVFDEKLYVDAENLSNFRRFSKMAKAYILALKNLVKYIQKFDKKKDSVAKIDQLFKKVKDIQSRYIQFTQITQVCEQTVTMDDVSNHVSQRSRQNAVKKLFNFAGQKKNQGEKSKNTLFKYNFKMNSQSVQQQRVSQPTKNVGMTNKSMKGDQLASFQQLLKDISNQNTGNNQQNPLQKFKKQFTKPKEKTQRNQNVNYFISIFDKDYYFSYHNFYMESNNNIDFLDPYKQYPFVNYEIDDEEVLNQLVGEDIDQQNQLSQCSELSNASFIVSDDYLSEDDDNENTKKKVELKIRFGEKWVYSQSKSKQNFQQNSQMNKYRMIILKDNQKGFSMSLIEQQQDFDETELKKLLINGLDRKGIQQFMSKQKIKMSKNKLDTFLKKYCSRIKGSSNSSKVVYRLKKNDGLFQIQQKQNNSCEGKNERSEEPNTQEEENKDRQFYSQGFNDKIRRSRQKNKNFSDSQITQGEDQITRKSKRIASKKSKNQSKQ